MQLRAHLCKARRFRQNDAMDASIALSVPFFGTVPPPDAAGWAAIAAFIAIVLSQLPPFGPWLWRRFRGPYVIISTRNSFGLSHWMGRVWLVLFMQIENEQAVSVAVASVDCAIRPVGGTAARPRPTLWLTAQTYFTGSPPNTGRLFVGTIRLQPNQHWQEVVNFLPATDDAEDEEQQELVDKFTRQIREKWDERTKSGDKNEDPVEIDAELVNAATAIFNRGFQLSRGEYEMYIAARDRDNRILGVTKFKFILFEGMIRSLRDVVDDYKYGWGVSEPVEDRKVVVEPRLVLVGSGPDVRREYRALLANP